MKRDLQSPPPPAQQPQRHRDIPRQAVQPRRFFQAARRQADPVPAPSTDPLLTVSQARERLTLRTDAAVYWHIRHNGLPVRRFGRAIRIDARELDAWSKRAVERPSLVIVRGA